MVRWKSSHAFAIERIKNEHRNRQVKKHEHRGSMEEQPTRRARFGGRCAHEKLHFFSSRSEKNNRLTTSSSMQNEIAAPSGQLYAAPNKLTTMFEIMMPLGPPSNSGARKSPKLNTKAKVAPATTPGIDSGKITFQKVCAGVAPKSFDASTRFRGICSSAA